MNDGDTQDEVVARSIAILQCGGRSRAAKDAVEFLVGFRDDAEDGRLLTGDSEGL
jgi:hypothetical protein